MEDRDIEVAGKGKKLKNEENELDILTVVERKKQGLRVVAKKRKGWREGGGRKKVCPPYCFHHVSRPEQQY